MGSQPQPVTRWVALGTVLTTGVALVAVLWPQRLDPAAQAAIISFGNALILAVASWRATSQVTPLASPQLPTGSVVKVQGTSDTVLIQPTPPGPVGYDQAEPLPTPEPEPGGPQG